MRQKKKPGDEPGFSESLNLFEVGDLYLLVHLTSLDVRFDFHT